MENLIDENLIAGDTNDKSEQSQGEADSIDKENIDLSNYLDKEILDLFHPTARKILDGKGHLAGVRAEITCPDPECGQVRVFEDHLVNGKFRTAFRRRHLEQSQGGNWHVEEEEKLSYANGNLDSWLKEIFCQRLKDYAPVYLNPDVDEEEKAKLRPICLACRVRKA